MFNTALVIGRFQSLNLAKEIEFLQKLKSDKIVVAIVAPQNPFTKVNPFDFHTISQTLLHGILGRGTCVSVKAKRYPEEWTAEIDKLALDCRASTVYIMGEFPKYAGPISVVHVDDPAKPLLEPHKFNKEITPDFREGIAYAVSRQFDRAYGTVDMAGFWDGNLLLGRKKNEKLWRFIGGFVDPKDESLEVAAKREFSEEAGTELIDPLYVCSMKVDDWRYKIGNDKIITTLFTGKIDIKQQPPVAGDDINDIKFFDFMSEIAMRPGEWKNMIIPEHVPLMGQLVRSVTSRTR